MDNLELYNKVRNVPIQAQKEIKGGRLNGKTDINPMWRIKTLTENFGACGIGWHYTIDRTWLDDGHNKEIIANVEISLFVKVGEEWSKPIKGLGGSMFTTNESKGIYTDDDCYKKALTDAISVACKALGIGADVYWEKDPTKHTSDKGTKPKQPLVVCDKCGEEITACKSKGVIYSPQQTHDNLGGLCKKCFREKNNVQGG